MDIYEKVSKIFYGYKLVDKSGVVLSKKAFVDRYPLEAEKVVADCNFPIGDIQARFDYAELNKAVYESIGFNIAKQRNFR